MSNLLTGLCESERGAQAGVAGDASRSWRLSATSSPAAHETKGRPIRRSAVARRDVTVFRLRPRAAAAEETLRSQEK